MNAGEQQPKHGGARPGSGRKPTGRKRRVFSVTDAENDHLRRELERMREMQRETFIDRAP